MLRPSKIHIIYKSACKLEREREIKTQTLQTGEGRETIYCADRLKRTD